VSVEVCSHQSCRGVERSAAGNCFFFDRQLQISGRGNYGCSKKLPLNSPKWVIFSPTFFYFMKKNFRQEENFSTG